MIMIGGATMIIGTIILASSTTLAQLLVGRIVTGIVCCVTRADWQGKIDTNFVHLSGQRLQ